jgi:hypothetical protein
VGKSVAYTSSPRIAVPAPTPAPSIPPAWRVATNERRLPHETELQKHYRQYDAAIELLPADLRPYASLTMSSCEGGVMRFLDSSGGTLAHVDLRTRSLRLIDATAPASPAPAPRVSTKEFVTWKRLEKTLTAIGKANSELIGDMLRPVAQSILEQQARIEALEKQLREALEKADNGRLCYRGYWREGMSAKRGDLWTEGGTTWFCNRGTNEKPNGASIDWNVFARKGTDGKGVK